MDLVLWRFCYTSQIQRNQLNEKVSHFNALAKLSFDRLVRFWRINNGATEKMSFTSVLWARYQERFSFILAFKLLGKFVVY